MRFYTYSNGGYGFKGIDKNGGVMTTPLRLPEPPTSAMDAVTRSYVESAFNSFNDSVISGNFSPARLPGFVGNDIASDGGGIFYLKPTGVLAGTYAKVSVNTKGRVTAGSLLTAQDIPTLSWSKVVNRPTTLAGYGITDVISLNGGEMTGALTLTQTATQDNHLVNKQYVDTKVVPSTGSTFVVGDVVQKTTDQVPVGFVRCNGGYLSKSVYAGLYAVVGDKYTPSEVSPGAGKPWKNSYAFDTNAETTMGAWTTGASLLSTVTDSQAIVTKNRVYLLGGFTDDAYSATVYTAPINPDGTLGTWTTSNSLPGTVAHSQAIVTKNRVYLLGGFTGNAFSATVYTAPINPDGTLGAWTTGASLPDDVYHSQAIVTKTQVYLLGGNTYGVSSSTVYTAPINPDGTLGAWTTSNSLPETVANSQTFVTKNRVYLFGGYDGNGLYSTTTYTAPINPDGTLGTWTTTTSLPVTVADSQAIVTKNRVYLLGGIIDDAYSATVHTAPINPDGTLGDWTISTSLPATVYRSQAIVTKNRVHLLGGYVNDTESSATYTAPITAGLNDYSPFYDGSYPGVDPNNFRLPDLTGKDKPGVHSYMKY